MHSKRAREMRNSKIGKTPDEQVREERLKERIEEEAS